MLSVRRSGYSASVLRFLSRQSSPNGRRPLLCKAAPTLLAIVIGAAAACAQDHARTAENSPSDALPDHVPLWASDSNYLQAVPPAQAMEPMTLVLARHPDREQAFEKLLADQQNPASPEYHHWLTPSQIGERYGLSTSELEMLIGWLQSQGLHVDWVAPARNFIGFSGAAGDVAEAFRTKLNYYRDEGKRKVSLASAPVLPPDLAPMVKAIHGLYTIENRPMSRVRAEHSDSPDFVLSNNGEIFITPSDFWTIYELRLFGPSEPSTVGIVGRSRTDFADFDNFGNFGGYVRNPIEIVPKRFGGVDPGPALTSPPRAGVSIADQAEATLDVERAGSFPGVQPILVVTTTEHGDIEADAQYLVQTDPIPAPVISISFGECESRAGKVGVDYWDSLFKQAAGEGISVFVASGDSGASGCDENFSTPPANPAPNSPNYICSSSYATCVGGTEFNDSNTSLYWNANSGHPNSYIPEGAWNEPLNANSEPQTASSGGGVSNFIPTPSWQRGNGVPAARTGRYTPDIAFSASQHDAYFGCMAAGGGSCAIENGGFSFVGFAGTSASAPGMAGIAALLVEAALGSPQGNLNPTLYSMAATLPYAFHDVTVRSSGVKACNVDTPSMCNNSIPGNASLSGGQPGYTLGTGYSEVTGLGSLDVNNFILWYPIIQTPEATTKPAIDVTVSKATLAGKVETIGQSAKYWFTYGKDRALTGPATLETDPVWLEPRRRIVPVTAGIERLAPGTKYYYRLQISNLFGTQSRGDILQFVTEKGSQTISFKQPVSSRDYGAAIDLSASSSSGLPVAFGILRGHAKLSRSTLTITGLEKVVVAANQAGNAHYLAAPQVTMSIEVNKAMLTVTANNQTMTQGGSVPPLTYTITGFVNGDTQADATTGAPALSTTATSASTPGSYPITVSAGTLAAARYNFNFVDETLTVNQ